MIHSKVLQAVGLSTEEIVDGTLPVYSPIDDTVIAHVTEQTTADVEKCIAQAQDAFTVWRNIPAPRRGELVRLLGEELRKYKNELGALITVEAGKIISEGLGEVQEMIDICDFAVGLSRQLYGLTIASERPGHRMMETWHPIGPCAIITAFNFPVAVWAWNTALALVCGNPIIWKPSEKTPLTALATMKIMQRAIEKFGHEAPSGLTQLVIGDASIGEVLAKSKGVPVVSATGSTRMGHAVGPTVMARWGRPILELGGNNAMIVTPSADLDMCVRAIVFSAVGTAGQRCTTLRRLIVHSSIKAKLVEKLAKAYSSLKIGDPREDGVLLGPLIDADALQSMQSAIEAAQAEGGTVHGGQPVTTEVPGKCYVSPALIEMPAQTETVKSETFAPILYVMEYEELTSAIAMQNDVPQGLSSCIFTLNMREAEYFLSAAGSDCGIANVNIGPSGAEIGGAFGGEKETGGGRESGSDAWRGYMRRQTNTINYSADLPLSQGVKFEI